MISPVTMASPRKMPVASAQPRFGSDLITSVINGAIQGASSPTDLKNKKGSTLKKFILFQLLPIGLLGASIANVDRVVQLVQWGQNMQNGRPLESVMAQKFPLSVTPGTTLPTTPGITPPRTEITEARAKELLATVEPWRAILSPQQLNEAAELGMVKEVQLLPYAAGKPQWNIVFIDGRERHAYEDTVLREKLASQLNIPIRNVFSGWSQDLIPSFTAAAVLVSALGVLLKRETFVRPDLGGDDKRRFELIQASQLLVAAHQGVSATLITKEVLDEQLLWAKQKEAFKPLDQQTLEKRLRVLLAAPVMERRFFSDNPSVGGSCQLETLNELTRTMVKSLGMSTELGNYTFPANMTDAEKAKLEEAVSKKIEKLTAETKAIIDTYSDAAVDNLVKGIQILHPPITQVEVKSLLEGKSAADVKTDRSFLGRTWKKWTTKPVATTPITGVPDKPAADTTSSKKEG